ncbi:KUP/HAK/KT family potassium transporter, partial [Bifidobacterium bohemicum]
MAQSQGSRSTRPQKHEQRNDQVDQTDVRPVQDDNAAKPSGRAAIGSRTQAETADGADTVSSPTDRKKDGGQNRKSVNLSQSQQRSAEKAAGGAAESISEDRKARISRKQALSAEKQALLRADTFTNAPKVSPDVLTEEEREEIAMQIRREREEAERMMKTSHSPVGRWWRKVQSSPDRVTLAMAVITLGVVYGDIGTSPLYTAQTFLAGQGGLVKVDRPAVLGMLSLVFWTLMLITTVKYVLVAMHADNKGEGGIFALFSLVRRYGKWLVVPAMIGGAAFLADSVLTPAVSISSAVEGLKTIPAFTSVFRENTSLSLMITIVIIVLLFCVQSRGTESIGKVFGSVVLVWFTFIALVGIVNVSGDWTVFAALNPVYGFEFLFSSHNVAGISLMGTVFLSTTG